MARKALRENFIFYLESIMYFARAVYTNACKMNVVTAKYLCKNFRELFTFSGGVCIYLKNVHGGATEDDADDDNDAVHSLC